jgi:hypothetical protein
MFVDEKPNMRQPMLKKLTLLILPLSVLAAAPVYIAAQPEAVQERPAIRRPMPQGLTRNRAVGFGRTELFFGAAKPDGVVTEEEFRAFLDQEVTPRFPDGLTVLEADGQFTGADGVLVREDAFVLVLLYPAESRDDSGRKIEHIRRLYMRQFQQESVLRVDDPLGVWVSF